MYDEFLYRLRKTPPTAFAARLKARLDRQERRARAPRSLRGLAVALALGGAALAVATGSLPNAPLAIFSALRSSQPPHAGERSSAASSATAPASAAAHDRAPRGGDADGVASASRNDRVDAIAPASRSGGADTIAPRPAARSGAAQGKPASTGEAEAASTSPRTRGRVGAAASGSVGTLARNQIRVVQTPSAAPYTEAAVTAFRRTHGAAPVVETRDASELAASFCEARWSAASPDILVRFGRIDRTELDNCGDDTQLVEVKVGYDVVVLARSVLYGALDLSSADVFRALARELPAGDGGGSYGPLQANRHTTWGTVNPLLPQVPIEVLGPPLDTPLGKSFIDQLMETGCRSLPLPRRPGDIDARACRAVRDGIDAVSDRDLVTRLQVFPTAIGILRYELFDGERDKLAAVRIGGVEPTVATLSSGAYPASRALFVYVDKARLPSVADVADLVEHYLGPASRLTWPDDGERLTALREIVALRTR